MSQLVPPPPPPGTNYIALIEQELPSLMLSQSFTVILLPLLIALFYFSSPSMRFKPIFILNLVNLALGFTSGVTLDYRSINAIISPLNPPSLSFNIAIGVLGDFQLILCDVILLIRLTAVYPIEYIGLSAFIKIIMLPVLLKIARLINLFLFVHALAVASYDPVNPALHIAQVWTLTPYTKIEWFMLVIDNSYASGFFLWRLVLRNQENREYSVQSSNASFVKRLQTLFWIAVTNFVFPCIFSIIQIIMVYREVNVAVVNQIVLVNTNLAIIGVVFATIWAGTAIRQDSAVVQSDGSPASQSKGGVMSAIVFHSAGRATRDTVDESTSSRTGSREKVKDDSSEDIIEVA